MKLKRIISLIASAITISAHLSSDMQLQRVIQLLQLLLILYKNRQQKQPPLTGKPLKLNIMRKLKRKLKNRRKSIKKLHRITTMTITMIPTETLL